MRTWAWLAAIAFSMTWARPAAAQDDAADQRARQHYESGTAYFDTGDYESALREFRASYRESPHPELLYNIFMCEERVGNLAAAVTALEAFLATPRVPRREVLERRLAHLRERAARGETRIEAGDVQGGEPLQVREPEPPSLEATAPDESTPPVAEASSDPTIAIAGFSIAAAGLVAFGVAGSITLAEDASLREDCAPYCAPAAVEAITASGIAADVGAAVALAGALLGVVGLVVDASAPRAGEVRARGLSLVGAF